MKLVLIEWLDAVTHDDNGWKVIEKVINQKPVLVRSVGWVVKDTKTHITLVSSIIRDEKEHIIDGDVTVPKGWIKKVIHLCPKKP